MREVGATIVAGNHDWAVVGKLDTSYFNPYAREAVEWTRSTLSLDDRLFLERLPLVERIGDDLELVHATLDQPELFDYIQPLMTPCSHSSACAARSASWAIPNIPISFIHGNSLTHTLEAQFRLPETARALINVGSVGQRRDDNPKTAVAVYDSKTREYTLLRVPYNAQQTAAKIRRAGLPDILGERLLFGR